MTKLTVKKMPGSKRFGIYAPDGTLLEGGFFYKTNAEEAKENWEKDLLNDEVEKAERAAGWDPNP